MNRLTALALLFLAALLEAGGDAVIRSALAAPSFAARIALFAAGAAMLFAYGCTVNAPAWDFGWLLGIYVVFFFVLAQIISWIAFHRRPALATWIGGAFIVAGGVVMVLGQPAP